MRYAPCLVAIVAFSLAPLVPSASAEAISSAYTPLKLKLCKDVTLPEAREYGGVFECEGYGGTLVRVAEGDLRMFVSYGPNAADQTAAQETLPQFNTIGETLEWRLASGKPFATILRFRWDSDNGEGSTLVVTKLGKGDSCHVAYIVATGNPNANLLAREVADSQARGFSCKRDRPRRYGPDGRQAD
ncbi:MAG: hypothetical protein R3D30_03190 [Hyphomicrobiales bacterium]